jgi:HlyD family secretion protein
MKGKKKLIIFVIIALIAVAAAIVISFSVKKPQPSEEIPPAPPTAEQPKTVKGTGMVIADTTYDITALVTGEVLASPFDVGDKVTEGQLLYAISARDLELQIKTAELSVSKCETLYSQSVKQQSDLVTYSPFSGKVAKLYVSNGDSVQSGAKIADIVDDSKLILKVPFNESDIPLLQLGDTAKITLAGNSSEFYGQIHRIYDAADNLSGHQLIKYVEIVAENPGALTKGEKATAIVDDIACGDVGEFTYFTEKTIVSSGNGQISTLSLLEGDFITAGRKVLTLKNAALDFAVENSKIAVSEAQNALYNLRAQLENYKITSPAGGKVIAKNIKKGDNAAPSTVLMSISDVTHLYVDVEIDELYISKVKPGQFAEITADAVEGEKFGGVVTRINDVGVAKNGVTYFPVRVKINENDSLKVAMNLSVEIFVDELGELT